MSETFQVMSPAFHTDLKDFFPRAGNADSPFASGTTVAPVTLLSASPQKKCQVAQLDLEQVPLTSPDLETPRRIQWPQELSDVDPWTPSPPCQMSQKIGVGDVEPLNLDAGDVDPWTPSPPETVRAISGPPNPRTPSPIQLQECSHNSRTDPLDDILRWIGSSSLGADHRLLPRDSDYFETQENVHWASESLDDQCDDIDKRELLWHALRLDRQHHRTANFPKTPKTAFQNSRLLPPNPVKQHSRHGTSQACLSLCSSPHSYDTEEEEWNQRQRQTGSIGRLVEYTLGDDPRHDILFRGGKDSPLVVANVVDGGCAQAAGVRVGDRLVSINGQKQFLGLSADELKESDLLKPPALFVFLGFVGKLQAEVRLANKDKPVGLPLNHAISSAIPSSPVQLCEERVIDTGVASLFIAVPKDGSKLPEQLFELNAPDARACVRDALRSPLHKANSAYPLGRHGDTPPQHRADALANQSSRDFGCCSSRLNPRYDFIVMTPRLCRASPRTSTPRLYRASPRTSPQKRPCLDPDMHDEPVL